MSVWYCIPSARPPEEAEPVLRAWRERGYKIALIRDAPWKLSELPCDMAGVEIPYPGYASSVNILASSVLANDPTCDWIVTGGDDILPDPNHSAEEIARECSEHFTMTVDWPSLIRKDYAATFGVMQPTGDRFAEGSIDRIAGSPWLGREWCLRANQGKGPFWPEFTHMFGDECLKKTAEKLGVYWMRPDLTHFHKHFMRRDDAIDSPATRTEVPPHLKKWNTQEHWNEMLAILRRLEAEDFAPCMPL